MLLYEIVKHVVGMPVYMHENTLCVKYLCFSADLVSENMRQGFRKPGGSVWGGPI